MASSLHQWSSFRSVSCNLHQHGMAPHCSMRHFEPLLAVAKDKSRGCVSGRNAVARQLQRCDGRGGASLSSAFFGSPFLPSTSPSSTSRRNKFRRCKAQYNGAYGNGYEYDARIPPPPNYIAFPLPTPPVDAQFLPHTALPPFPQQGPYYAPQQQQPPFYPPLSPPQSQQPVGVFWDIENSTIPRGARVGAIVRRIRAVAQQFGRVRSLKAYGKVDVIEHYIDDLVAAGVEVLPVPDGKEMADKAIITDALLFALDSIDQPGGSTQRGTVIIASGDKGFASVLGKLSARGIRTVMLARRRTQKGGHIPTVITNSVDYTYDWEDLVPDSLRDMSHEPVPAPPARKPAQPPPVNTKSKHPPPSSQNGDDTMPIWRPLGAQESSNGRGKAKAAAKPEANEPPQKKAKSAPKETAESLPAEAAKSEAGSKYVLERLRNLSSAEQAAVTSLAGIRSEKVYPYEMEELGPAEDEGSTEDEGIDTMEPLTEIRGAPSSQLGAGRAMWPHKWKTSLQTESKRKPTPKVQAPKRETVVWNPLDEAPPSDSEEAVGAGPFAFLPQAEQLLSSRTPLKGSEVADKALEMLQSALKGQPDVSKLSLAGAQGLTLGVKVDADAQSRLKAAEMLAAARQQMLKVSAEKDGSRAASEKSQESDQPKVASNQPDGDDSLIQLSKDSDIVTRDSGDEDELPEERPKLTDAALQLAAEMGFSSEQMARVVKAALLEKKAPVYTGDRDGILDSAVVTNGGSVADEWDGGSEGGMRPGENVNVVRLKNQLRLVLHQEGPCAFTSLPGKYTKVVGHPLKLSDFGFKKLQDMSASFDDVVEVSISFMGPSVSSTEVREAAAKERQVFLTRSPRNLQLLSLITSGLRNLIHELLADAGQAGKTVGSLVYWITVCTNTSMESFLVAHGYLRSEGLPRTEQELATHKMLIDMADIIRLEYGTSERFKNVKCFLQYGAEPDRQADVFSSPEGKDVPYKAPDPPIAYTENDIVVPKLPVALELVIEGEVVTNGGEKENIEKGPETASSGVEALKESAVTTSSDEQDEAKEGETSLVEWDSSEGVTDEGSLAKSEGSTMAGDSLMSSENRSDLMKSVQDGIRLLDSHSAAAFEGTSASKSPRALDGQEEPSSDSQVSAERSESGSDTSSQQEGLEVSLGVTSSGQDPLRAAEPLEGTNVDIVSLVEDDEITEASRRPGDFDELSTSLDSQVTSSEAANDGGLSFEKQSSALESSKPSSSTESGPPGEDAPSKLDPILVAQRNWELSKPSDVIDLRSANKNARSGAEPAFADVKVAATSTGVASGQAIESDEAEKVREEISADVRYADDRSNKDQPSSTNAEREDTVLDTLSSAPDVSQPLVIASIITEADKLSDMGGLVSERTEVAPSEAGPADKEGFKFQSTEKGWGDASTSSAKGFLHFETSEDTARDGFKLQSTSDTAEEGSSGKSVELDRLASASELSKGEHVPGAVSEADEEGASSIEDEESDLDRDIGSLESGPGKEAPSEGALLADKERDTERRNWERLVMHSRWRMFNHDVMMLVTGASDEGWTLTVDALLARYREAFGRRMDADLFRTEKGSPTTLRKRLSLVPGIVGVNENAIGWEGGKKALGKQLAVTSGLRQVLWTFLADAYPRRLAVEELVDELQARLPGHSLPSILEAHQWAEGAESLVLEVGDFIVRHQQSCTIDIQTPPPLLRDARLLRIPPQELDLPLFKELEQKGLRGEGEGPLYGWLEQCEWAPEWLDLVVGWFSKRGAEGAFTQGARFSAGQSSKESKIEGGKMEERGESLTERREWEEESGGSEKSLQLEARSMGWESEGGEHRADSDGEGEPSRDGQDDDVSLDQDDVSSSEEAAYPLDEEDGGQGDVGRGEAAYFSEEDSQDDVTKGEVAYFSEGDGQDDVSKGEAAYTSAEEDAAGDFEHYGGASEGVAAIVSWDEITALQDAAEMRHKRMLILGSLQEGPHPQGVSYPKLRKVYRARTGEELSLSLEELLSEPRLIRRPHFDRTGLLSVHVSDQDKLGLNAARSGLRQIVWWIAQHEYPRPISHSLVERRCAELCSLNLGTCLEMHGLGPQVNNRFKGWAALGLIKELIWYRATPKQQNPGEWSPPLVHLWKASPPPMMKDPPLLGLNPHEMEFELLRRVKEESGVSCWRLTHPTVGAKSWRKEYKKVVKKWKRARQTAGVLGLEREPRGSLRRALYESEDESDSESRYHSSYQGGDQEYARPGLTVYDLEELDEGRDADTWRTVRGDSSADDEASDEELDFESLRYGQRYESDQEGEAEIRNGAERGEESDSDQGHVSGILNEILDQEESKSDQEHGNEILDEEDGQSLRWRSVQSRPATGSRESETMRGDNSLANDAYSSDSEFDDIKLKVADDSEEAVEVFDQSLDGRDAVWPASEFGSAAEELAGPQGGHVSREWLSEESESDDEEELECLPVRSTQAVSKPNARASNTEDEATTFEIEQPGEDSAQLWAGSGSCKVSWDAHKELEAEEFEDATEDWTFEVAPVFWPGAEWEDDDDTAFRLRIRGAEWGEEDADVSNNGSFWRGDEHEGGSSGNSSSESCSDDGDAAAPLWGDLAEAVESRGDGSESSERGSGVHLAAQAETADVPGDEVDECMEEPFVDAHDGRQSFWSEHESPAQHEEETEDRQETLLDTKEPPRTHDHVDSTNEGTQDKKVGDTPAPLLRSLNS